MNRPFSASSFPLKSRLAGALILLSIRALGLSYKFRLSGDADRLRSLLSDNRGFVIAGWHNRMFCQAAYVCRYLLPRGFKLAMLTSESRDGEVGAVVGAYAGVKMLRGSSSRKGASGLLGVYRAMAREGYSTLIFPDGSKGPVYKAKTGVVALARMTGCPILPLSCWSDKQWRIRSWDRMIFPKPGASMLLSVGKPIFVPKRGGEAADEGYRLQVERELDRLGFAAEVGLSPMTRCI